MEKIDVVLPGGGKLDDHFARVALVPYKALIKSQDNIVGLQSVEATSNQSHFGNRILIGPPDVQNTFRSFVTGVLNDSGDLAKNVSMGLRELKTLGYSGSRVLILTMDLPFVDEKSLLAFLEMCPEDADLAVPVVSKEEYLDRFPGSSSTFAKLSDGNFTVGCAYVVKPDAFLRMYPKIEQVIANRKSVPKLAKLVGFPFLLRYLMKSLSSNDAKSKIEEITGAKISLIRGAPAELAFDIDEIVDYEYALRNK